MKKSLVIDIVEKYLQIFPNEKERLHYLQDYLKTNDEKDICNWNNADGHITAGGFVYSKLTKKFLVMWHKDLKMFLYPGGHTETGDVSPLERAKIEAKEETGLQLLNLKLFGDEQIPIDIDTHKIPFNPRVNMPEHFHFDFRYIFVCQDENGVDIDKEEMQSYKWIDSQELSKDPNYGNIVKKLKNYL